MLLNHIRGTRTLWICKAPFQKFILSVAHFWNHRFDAPANPISPGRLLQAIA